MPTQQRVLHRISSQGLSDTPKSHSFGYFRQRKLQTATKRPPPLPIADINTLLVHSRLSTPAQTDRFFLPAKPLQTSKSIDLLGDAWSTTLESVTHRDTEAHLHRYSTRPKSIAPSSRQTERVLGSPRPEVKRVSNRRLTQFTVPKPAPVQQEKLIQKSEPDREDLKLFQSGLAVPDLPIIDPVGLREMYNELMGTHRKIDQHMKENAVFLDKLFDDGTFEPWLKTSNAILSQKELDFVVETFTLKQELIDSKQKIDELDFEMLDSLLARLGFFERFTKSTRINILKLASYLRVPAGEYVFYQGDYGDNLYVILRGSVTVKVDKEYEKGVTTKLVVSSLFDGQHFGELAMMETKQKDEYEVLEEKLETVNVATMAEVKRQLFRADIGKLEQESKFLVNRAMHEMKSKGHNPEEMLRVDEDVRAYAIEIVNETPTNAKSSINYKKQKAEQVRTASIQASETCHLLTIGRENFKSILMVLMQDELEVKIQMLKSLRFFAEVQPFVLIPLANQLLLNQFGLDEVIVREGQTLTHMYIVYKGTCNVVRQVTTSRKRLPSPSAKGAIKATKPFVFGDGKVDLDEKRMFKSPRDVPLAKTEGRIDKVAEFMVQQLDDERVTYKHSYVYRVLQPGDIIFGRALTGCTLEGAKGEDCARMTITSSANNTVLYSLTPRQLLFCPDFLREHLTNTLVTMQDVDHISPQPINKDIKRLTKLLERPKNLSEAERKVQRIEAVRQKQVVVGIKRQQETKQDHRNRDWEEFKRQLVAKSVHMQGSDRIVKQYKKY